MKKTAPASPPRATPGLRAAEEAEPGPGLGLAALLYFGLSLVYFLPAFLPGRGIFGSDYLGGSYQFQVFISQQFADGRLPGWVPYLYGGLPFYSSPGNAYHPVRLLGEALLPTSKILPFVFWFHFGAAGVGMYLLARELKCRPWVAFVAGLAWQMTGILNSWVWAGHDGRVMVVSLAPLFFYFLHRGIRTERVAPFAGAAATLGFALLSFQIQNAYYMLLSGAAWAVFALAQHGTFRRPAALAKMAGLGIAAVALGFALAAVNFIPFADYVEDSPRAGGGRGYEFATSYSLPAKDLVGLAVPEQVGSSVFDPQTSQPLFPQYHGGRQEIRLHTEYVGATVLVLLALGIVFTRRNRYWWFFLGTGLFFLTMALGGNTPLYRIYYAVLPGLRQFRAPDLAYYVLAMALVAMAALTLERIAELRAAAATRRGELSGSENLGRVPLAVGAVVGIAILGAGLMGTGGADRAAGMDVLPPAMGWMRFAVFAALAGGALWMWTTGRMGTRGAFVALALVTVLDLWVIDRKFFRVVTPDEETRFAADDVVGFLHAQPGPARIWALPGGNWPPSPNYPMLFGIDQAGGEHPNVLQRYYDFVGAGQGSYVDWHNFLGDPRFLAAANVRYLVTPGPVEFPWPGFRQVHQGSAVVYENTLALPRAYLVGSAVRVDRPEAALPAFQNPSFDPRTTAVVEAPRDLGLPGGAAAAAAPAGTAQITTDDPDRVVIRTQADRPALLVLADNFYDGWKATVDGRAAETYRTNVTFRGVVVPAGAHTVEFVFEVPALRTGFYVYLACFAALALYGLFLLARHFRKPRGDAGGEAAA